jgi:hypothetical protein
MVYLGSLCEKEGWREHIHRKKRCDLSLFQLGLRLLEHFLNEELPVVLEKSNLETLAASLYLSVHALRQEDYDDRDAASAGEIEAILVSKSTVSVVQSSQ